jgi:hypothetical protein
MQSLRREDEEKNREAGQGDLKKKKKTFEDVQKKCNESLLLVAYSYL